jgi:xylulokinase
MLRAVLEGITLNLRVILEAFTAQGAAIESLRVIGGGARSAVWNRIMADVFGVPVQRLAVLEEATSLGAALAGGIGVGIWNDFSQVDAMVRVESTIPPDTQRRQLYDDLFKAFNDTYVALDGASVFTRLASL